MTDLNYNTYFEKYKELAFNEEIYSLLNDFKSIALKVKNENAKLIFAGNGGSFSDSQHISSEFIGRLNFDREPLPAICLG